MKCKLGDRFYLADNTDVHINDELIKENPYVDHNADQDSGSIVSEAVGDLYIRRILELNGITEIRKHKNAIMFEEDGLMDPDGYESCGFYYSPDGNPQTVLFYEGQFLIKDGDGWSYVRDKEYKRYYTEKIKDNYYYYEEVFYP